MRRTRTSLLRRIVMWAAGVVLGLSVLGMTLGALPDHLLRVQSGCLVVKKSLVTHDAAGGTLTRSAVSLPADWWWPPKGMLSTAELPGTTVWVVVLPLWMPTMGAAIVLGSASLLGRRARARARRGLCPTCAYDLAGIDGVCPECGLEPKA